MRESESLTPVTKIAGDHKDCSLVQEERQEKFCIGAILCLWDITNHQRYNFKITSSSTVKKDLLDKRKMHLKTMLILFHLFANFINLYSLSTFCSLDKIVDSLFIDSYIAQGSRPLLAGSCSYPIEENFVRRTKDNHSIKLAHFLSKIFVSPGRRGTAVS